MKALEPLNISRLSILEFGQHLKSVLNNINMLGNGSPFVFDVNLKEYIDRLVADLIPYDKAMLQVSKSDETEKIVAADKVRDAAVTTILRFLSVFELSEVEEEKLAFASLETLFKTYKGIQNWNFEEESNGLDNLIVDLESSKYASHVAKLGINSYVQRIKTTNNDFKSIFAKRTQENSIKEIYDSKALRAG